MNLSTELTLGAAFLTALIITYLSIPTLVKVAKAKGLYDVPGVRKSHTNNIPTLGGVAIFASLLITFSIFINFESANELKYLIAGITLIFFIGIKDDILVIAPDKKLIGELIAAGIIIYLGDLRITSLHGFFGIHELPYWISFFLTLFVVIVVLNGMNLIDGIDGLASGVGIVAAFTFGIWFYLVGNIPYTILALAIVGALLSFIRFNIYQGQYKIFMGDTGSLIIGLLLAVMAIKFNQINIQAHPAHKLYSSPAVSFGILIVPLFDTLRVFMLRILKGKSPFKADKNHVHHRLLRLGFTHLGASTRIILINISFIIFVFAFDTIGILDLMVIILAAATVLSYIPMFILRRRLKAEYSIIPQAQRFRFKVKMLPKDYLERSNPPSSNKKTRETISI
jgi:UDP-N-acetylmuramyl pentapeptide phosphotransferase/UDP-N-acetylglucosamine-1-phosphate transferase